MDFRVLGPLEVWDGGSPVQLGRGKERALLAVLLLHDGEVVSTDRLVEALWGEAFPSTAVKSVQVYVSHLRKLLGSDAITTGPGGYTFDLTPGALDLHRFELLIDRARDASPAVAAELLREALELWRGPPLADFAYEPFAQPEIARLEELRLAALEARIEADLALGRHAELVSELEALALQHPLREGLRAQLMLALYRSGRQADALAAYQDARRTLGDELGLEPGRRLQELERAILTQDAELDAPESAATALTARRRGGILVATGGALLLAAVAVAVLALTRQGGDEGISTLATDSIGVIDASSHRIVAEMPVAGAPARLATGRPSVWVGSDDSGTISGVDPTTHTAAKLVAIGGFPSDLAVGEGAVWIADGERGLLVKVDPAYGTVAGKVRVADRNFAYDRSREGVDPTAVAAGLGSVWTTDGSRRLTRIDPASIKIVDRIDLRSPINGVAVGAGAVWAISGAAATAIRLDHHGRVTTRIQIVSKPGFESPYPLVVETGEGFVWVLNGNTATVTKIDPQQRGVAATIPIGIDRGPVRLAVGAGAAWVANGDGTLARIDARTNAIDIISVAHRLKDVAVFESTVWVTAAAGLSSSVAASGNVRGVRALPASFCAPIYYAGRGPPQYLIASDLPLQGAGRTGTAQLADAIEFVLRQHQFRAGRYAVGYQSCNDATVPLGSPSEARCAANADAYARNRNVIGVIGAFTSNCSVVEVPIANGAAGGPLPMISPSTTYVGLTRHGSGTDPDEPERYYPTGRRSFVRVIPADDLQAAADALLARRLGARRIYVVHDEGSYGIAGDFQSAARKLGLTIVGYALWDPESPKPIAIADRARRARADTVLIASYVAGNPRFGTLIRRLRAKLGPGARIMATDGFSDFEAVVRIAGSAAEGMTVSVTGLPNERLPKTGKAFVAAFGKAVGQPPSQFSVYAAQAAEVLLAAIARSDGTRASVTAQLFKTKVSNGILGSFSIDENGDTTESAVTIYRIVNRTPKILEVITPPQSLVR